MPPKAGNLFKEKPFKQQRVLLPVKNRQQDPPFCQRQATTGYARGIKKAKPIAALGVDDAGDGLHQLFHAPEAATRQIDDIVCGIHIGDLLVGPVKSRSVHVCFLSALFLRHSLLPGSSAVAKSRANTLRYIAFPPFRGSGAHSAPCPPRAMQWRAAGTF